MKKFFYCLIVLEVLWFSHVSPGQQNPNLEQGITPYGSYHAGDIDMISLSSGNVSLYQILKHVPQRGGMLDLDYFFKYNNKNYAIQSICDPVSNICTWFWTLRGNDPGVDYVASGVEVTENFVLMRTGVATLFGCDVAAGTCIYDMSLSANTADGGSHAFGQLPHPGKGMQFGTTPPSGFVVFTNGARSLDGTNLLGLPQNGQIVFPSGVQQQIDANPFLIDPNGNEINADWVHVAPNNTGLADTLGRSLPLLVTAINDPQQAPGYYALPSTSNFSGCTGPNPIASARVMNFPAFGGGSTPEVIKLCFAEVSLQTNFPPTGVGAAQVSGSLYFLQSIVLPNQTAWTFEYNSSNPGDPPGTNYGDLSQVTFPTGGTLSYTWQTVPFCSPDPTTGLQAMSRAVATRTLNANDGTGNHTWAYNFAPASINNNGVMETAGQPITTTVKDPLQNQAIHTFTDQGGCTYYETNTQYFDNANNLLKTISTQYTGPAGGSFGIYPTKVTATWPNGEVMETDKTYLGVNTTGTAGTFSWEFFDKTYPAAMGNPTDEYDYDYGNPSHGPLLRQNHTDYQFATSSNSNYLNFQPA